MGRSSVHRIRWGLDPGGVECTLDLRLFTGMKVGRGGLGTEKVFDKEVVTVPYQLTLPRPPQEDPRFVAVDAAAPLEQPGDARAGARLPGEAGGRGGGSGPRRTSRLTISPASHGQ